MPAAIPYTIVHRSRVTRRIHLKLDDDGELLVVAPRGVRKGLIERYIQQNADHVARFVARAQQCLLETPPKSYQQGEEQLFLGEPYELFRDDTAQRRPGVYLKAGRLTLCAPSRDLAQRRELLRTWYRAQAMHLFSERLSFNCRRAPWVEQLPPLKLRRMKRTWGSCSKDGRIMLNTHLVKAPMHLVDYVIAHELCHLREHNHGRRFYALQQELNPRWRANRIELKTHGHRYLHD